MARLICRGENKDDDDEGLQPEELPKEDLNDIPSENTPDNENVQVIEPVHHGPIHELPVPTNSENADLPVNERVSSLNEHHNEISKARTEEAKQSKESCLKNTGIMISDISEEDDVTSRNSSNTFLIRKRSIANLSYLLSKTQPKKDYIKGKRKRNPKYYEEERLKINLKDKNKSAKRIVGEPGKIIVSTDGYRLSEDRNTHRKSRRRGNVQYVEIQVTDPNQPSTSRGVIYHKIIERTVETCPICFEDFDKQEIAIHSSNCGYDPQSYDDYSNLPSPHCPKCSEILEEPYLTEHISVCEGF